MTDLPTPVDHRQLGVLPDTDLRAVHRLVQQLVPQRRS